MAFRREYKIEVVNATNPIQRFVVDHVFTSPQDRDLHLESVGETYLANRSWVVYVDNEASLAGRVYRHYLHQASEIDSGADYQSVVYGNFPSANPADQVTVKLNANRYLVKPVIERFVQPEGEDTASLIEIGKLRKQLFDSILSVQGSMITPDLNPRLSHGIQVSENSVDVNELVFEDNSKLFVTNPDNEPDRPYPFQVSLTIWDGRRYL